MTARGVRQAAAAADQGLESATWRALGTSVQLVVTEHLTAARHAVEDVLEEVDRAASRFRDDSELSRLPVGEWQQASPLLARLLGIARDAAEWTDGLVDPTVGATLSDLGYDRTFSLVARDGTPLGEVRRPTGWRDLLVEGTRVKAPVGLDLGATAKAVAADLAAEAVGRLGITALVSLGGDVAVTGTHEWPVLVSDTADPDALDDSDDSGEVISLVTGGLATSGTRSRRWSRGGHLVHHLLDPRTGQPTAGPWRTASVLAETCVLANVASTAAIVLGDAAARWLHERGFSARLVAEDGTVVRTGDWPAPAGEVR